MDLTERVGRGGFARGLNCPTGYYAVKGTTNLHDRVGALGYFEPDSDPFADNVVALTYGVSAVSKQLNTFLEPKLQVSTYGIFGGVHDIAAKRVQELLGVPGGADGLVGPNTCKYMYQDTVAAIEKKYTIPEHMIYRVCAHESHFDPGAVGVSTPDDKGIAQINLPSHPTVTRAQAFDPNFAFDFVGKYLSGKRAKYLSNRFGVNPLYAAVVAYNSPARADNWVNTGVLSPTGQAYLASVLNQTVVP